MNNIEEPDEAIEGTYGGPYMVEQIIAIYVGKVIFHCSVKTSLNFKLINTNQQGQATKLLKSQLRLP